MSILIDAKGKTLVKEEAINGLLSPVQVGKFIISTERTILYAMN